MPDFAEIIAAASPREETIEVCVSGALNSAYEQLERQLRDAGDFTPTALSDVDPRVEIERQMEELRSQMRAHTFVLTFRALPAKDWSDLQAAHPPRDGQREQFNPVTYPSALIAACAVDPAMTAAQVDQLFSVLNQGQRDLLFAGAWSANQGFDVPFSSAASGTQPS